MTLAQYLDQHEIKAEQFAALIGTSQAAVSRYMTGARHPRPDVMRRIIAATDGMVTANDFLSTLPQEAA